MHCNDSEKCHICDERSVQGIEVTAHASAAIHAGKKHRSESFLVADTILTRWLITDS